MTLFIVILVALVLIALAGGGVYVYLKRSKIAAKGAAIVTKEATKLSGVIQDAAIVFEDQAKKI